MSSWLLAKRGTVKVHKDFIFLGRNKVSPKLIEAYEKTSWFTQNYYIVKIKTEMDIYTVSLSNKLYKKVNEYFDVLELPKHNNVLQNLFVMFLILVLICSILKLIFIDYQ